MQSLQILKGERNNKQMREKENQRLLEEYYDTLLQLRHLRAAFQQLTDHDLITACVYEMNAMQQRYAYLLQRIKEEKLTPALEERLRKSYVGSIMKSAKEEYDKQMNEYMQMNFWGKAKTSVNMSFYVLIKANEPPSVFALFTSPSNSAFSKVIW